MHTAVSADAPRGARAGSESLPRILCVDDEPHVLEGLKDSLRRGFDVRVALGGKAALAMLKADRYGFAVIISDMRMPGMSGAEFLRDAKRVAPRSVRMLLTGHADADAAAQAVNEGQIFRFLTKPCGRDELERACSAALWQHQMLNAERTLLEQTLRGSIQALTDVLALASPAAFGRAGRVKRLIADLAVETGWDDAWEVEVAAMLADIGAVTLPEATAEKLNSGAPLSQAEQEMVDRVPAVTERILANIPRLEGVQQILADYGRRFDSSQAGDRCRSGRGCCASRSTSTSSNRTAWTPPECSTRSPAGTAATTRRCSGVRSGRERCRPRAADPRGARSAICASG